MRYAAPVILAALMLGGCAGTCGMHEQKTEPDPEVRQDETAPLLEDIPLLGHLFKRQETKADASDVPLLQDIPLLGFLFKRTDATEE